MSSPRTVGRGKPKGLPDLSTNVTSFVDDSVSLRLADAVDCYSDWAPPTTIISDGAYGVLGFEGDTSDHLDVPAWYEAHVAAWSKSALPSTTLWFWNSEIGWAATHSVLERHGWRYVHCNIWNKGIGHVAGNVNSKTIRRFPVVTEVCVQYVREPRVDGLLMKEWILREWRRTGLPCKRANDACGVKDAATRKYFDQGHLWYFPPPEAMEKLSTYANAHGDPIGQPYFAIDGAVPDWKRMRAMRSKFHCPHGVTNVWDRPAVRGTERVKVKGKAVHLNQKPLDLMTRIIQTSSDEGDVVWEPFGGLFSAALAAKRLGRRAYGAEIDPDYFNYGVRRFLEV